MAGRTWPRTSPVGFCAVCTLKYHWPAIRSVTCCSVSVADPLIGVASAFLLIGTWTPAFCPTGAGPWKCAAVAGPDNPQPASRFVTQSHDVPVDGSKVRFALDYLGMACHGDCHTHVDALCHISYDGRTYEHCRENVTQTAKGI